MSNLQSSELISIIIPCYNHAQYLGEAIESVLRQSYQCREIIVVDDGSTDYSKKVAESYPQVRYVYQKNQGLSAARNAGINYSTGKFLIFLDADDWLFEGALEINLQYLTQNENAAFVSGAHQKINIHGEILEEGRWGIQSNHYQQLLEGNYIGMHATVMYRRWIFDVVRYDTHLNACEDYDLYLTIARTYPVVHHEKMIAAYRIHDSNMSGDIWLMLTTVLSVLDRQKVHFKNKTERGMLQKGTQNLESLLLYRNL